MALFAGLEIKKSRTRGLRGKVYAFACFYNLLAFRGKVRTNWKSRRNFQNFLDFVSESNLDYLKKH